MAASPGLWGDVGARVFFSLSFSGRVHFVQPARRCRRRFMPRGGRGHTCGGGGRLSNWAPTINGCRGRIIAGAQSALVGVSRSEQHDEQFGASGVIASGARARNARPGSAQARGERRRRACCDGGSHRAPPCAHAVCILVPYECSCCLLPRVCHGCFGFWENEL